METRTITHRVILETNECLHCGGIYALSKNFLQRRSEIGGSWHCPYCRGGIMYRESDKQKLERDLQCAKNRLAREVARHDQTRASLSAQKGVNTRLKNRVSKGVCPCCNRYFKNLHRHMENKHPGYRKKDT